MNKTVSLVGSHHQRLTRAVETVEKVLFQKYILKSGAETSKSALFLCSKPHFGVFKPVVGDFVKIFQAKGFSTVSLGAGLALNWKK